MIGTGLPHVFVYLSAEEGDLYKAAAEALEEHHCPQHDGRGSIIDGRRMHLGSELRPQSGTGPADSSYETFLGDCYLRTGAQAKHTGKLPEGVDIADTVQIECQMSGRAFSMGPKKELDSLIADIQKRLGLPVKAVTLDYEGKEYSPAA